MIRSPRERGSKKQRGAREVKALVQRHGGSAAFPSVCDNSSDMVARWAALLLLTPLLLAGGCGYHKLNGAVHLPSNARTLAIPSFRNNTQSYHTEAAFTEAVIREFTDRTSYRVIAGQDPAADATLLGTITSYQIVPLTYDATTGQSSSFLVTITASLKLVDQHGQTIWENSNYLFRQQYEQNQDLASFIEEDSAATHRLAGDFASAAVADILESW
jgi:outer membrane lipopolysaccharide assembly protein LptE/RlpB